MGLHHHHHHHSRISARRKSWTKLQGRFSNRLNCPRLSHCRRWTGNVFHRRGLQLVQQSQNTSRRNCVCVCLLSACFHTTQSLTLYDAYHESHQCHQSHVILPTYSVIVSITVSYRYKVLHCCYNVAILLAVASPAMGHWDTCPPRLPSPTISFLVHFGSKSESQLSQYCVVCEISWCRCQQLTALSTSTSLVTKLFVIEQLLHPAMKSAWVSHDIISIFAPPRNKSGRRHCSLTTLVCLAGRFIVANVCLYRVHLYHTTTNARSETSSITLSLTVSVWTLETRCNSWQELWSVWRLPAAPCSHYTHIHTQHLITENLTTCFSLKQMLLLV